VSERSAPRRIGCAARHPADRPCGCPVRLIVYGIWGDSFRRVTAALDAAHRVNACRNVQSSKIESEHKDTLGRDGRLKGPIWLRCGSHCGRKLSEARQPVPRRPFDVPTRGPHPPLRTAPREKGRAVTEGGHADERSGTGWGGRQAEPKPGGGSPGGKTTVPVRCSPVSRTWPMGEKYKHSGLFTLLVTPKLAIVSLNRDHDLALCKSRNRPEFCKVSRTLQVCPSPMVNKMTQKSSIFDVKMIR